MRYPSLLAALAIGVVASHAMAATPVIGTTSGVWVHPTPSASPIAVTGVGTANFTWGVGSGSPPNQLNFISNAFSSTTETPFKVGSIRYFNGTTESGTVPDSVQLALTLSFSAPALPGVVSGYTFNLVSTPNTSDPTASADFVDLPSAFSSTLFTIGSTTYNVKLIGFENIVGDGFLASDSQSFHVREGGTASADLYAEVTTETAAVPEPANVALMLAGLGMMGLVARRRRH